MQFFNRAYLLIGGNVGNRINYLHQAFILLNQSAGKVVLKSPVYETAPWGNMEQPAFLNQALELQTTHAPEALMQRLLLIEAEMGRRRYEKYGPRTIDIDILLYNEEVHQSADLTIPHKELQNRRFALQPLSDIAGNAIHPVFNKTISQLLIECPDTLEVKRI